MSAKVMAVSGLLLVILCATLYSSFGTPKQGATPVAIDSKSASTLTYNLSRPYGKMERKEIGDRIIKLEGVQYVRFEDTSTGVILNVFYKGVSEESLRKSIDQIGVDDAPSGKTDETENI